jgi:hypothetical protein
MNFNIGIKHPCQIYMDKEYQYRKILLLYMTIQFPTILPMRNSNISVDEL